ncbi:MAG: AAA family ATPase [Alphaproteobacteria bacterium]
MTENNLNVNGGVINLQNVGIIVSAFTRLKNKASYLPGLVVVHGPSGYGKTVAATYAANKFGAYYISCKSTWTKKAMLLAISKEMGIAPAKTMYEMIDQVAEQLILSGRMLIVDEFDYAVDKNMVDCIRDIYQASEASIILIGEEKLPKKLEKFERFHNRILSWIAAQPASFEDAKKLREYYCDKVEIDDELLNKVLEVCDGRIRRICVNLSHIQDIALNNGASEVTLDWWGSKPLFTGSAPVRRL